MLVDSGISILADETKVVDVSVMVKVRCDGLIDLVG